MIKVAIIYAKAGGGHASLAHGVIENLDTTQFQTEMFDPFPPSFGLTHKTLSNYFGDVYRLGLKATENPKVFPAIKGFNELTIIRKLTNFLLQFQPDIVIANHPLAAAALPAACEKSGLKPCQVIHFCDPFTTHKTWFINKTADLYLSPTPEMTNLAIRHGIPKPKITTIGWLTRKTFIESTLDQNAARKLIGIDPAKVTFFLGGAGQGSTNIEAICHLFTQSPVLKSTQLIINTGLNGTLVNQIMRLVQTHPRQLFLFPYVLDTTSLLTAADVVIGKAGPNFIFETIQRLRPLIISGHLAGHEDGNPAFIKKANLGWVEPTPEKVITRLEQLTQKSALLHSKDKALQKVKTQHAAAGANLQKALTQLLEPVQTPAPVGRFRALFVQPRRDPRPR